MDETSSSLSPTLEHFFVVWARIVEKSVPEDDCLIWTGWLTGPDGFGRIKFEDRIQLVHEISWRAHFGEIPPRRAVVQSCGARQCCNPVHLTLTDEQCLECPGCGSTLRSTNRSGMCLDCASYFRRTGELPPSRLVLKWKDKVPRVCSRDGCGRPKVSLGICQLHYDRVRLNGSPDRDNEPTGYCFYCDKPLEWFGERSPTTGDRRFYCGNECLKRTTHLWGRYGLTMERYRRILKAQAHACGICRRNFNDLEGCPHVDHHHVTGVIRGILCDNCNYMIGQFRDNVFVLRRAAEYVRIMKVVSLIRAPIKSPESPKIVLRVVDEPLAQTNCLQCGEALTGEQKFFCGAPCQRKYGAIRTWAFNCPYCGNETLTKNVLSAICSRRSCSNLRCRISKYGISIETFRAMWDHQHGCCLLCGISETNTTRALAIDHQHDTGMVRSLLCDKCNWGVGFSLENFFTIILAIFYLNRTMAYHG